MNYIEKLKEIYKELADMKLTPANRLIASVSILQEMGKDSRTPNYQKEIKIKDPNSPATEKQKDYLKKLNITFPENLSKEEAMILIKENKNKIF